jgi:hypothetical protein
MYALMYIAPVGSTGSEGVDIRIYHFFRITYTTEMYVAKHLALVGNTGLDRVDDLRYYLGHPQVLLRYELCVAARISTHVPVRYSSTALRRFSHTCQCPTNM